MLTVQQHGIAAAVPGVYLHCSEFRGINNNSLRVQVVATVYLQRDEQHSDDTL